MKQLCRPGARKKWQKEVVKLTVRVGGGQLADAWADGHRRAAASVRCRSQEGSAVLE